MRSLIVLVAAAAAGLLATSASAQPTNQDRAFLQQAHQANLAEISAGQLAQQKGQSAAVKEIGATMVADHSTLDASVQVAAANLGVRLPAGPSAEQQAVANQLQQAKGASFDQLYLRTQLEGHQQTMAALQAEIAKGEAPKAQNVAWAAVPVVAKHISMLQAAGALPPTR